MTASSYVKEASWSKARGGGGSCGAGRTTTINKSNEASSTGNRWMKERNYKGIINTVQEKTDQSNADNDDDKRVLKER